MGASSPRPDRTLLDWVDDVVELAELLDIDRLRVIGYSGGGPYALACGFRLPGRVDALVVVSGSAPMDRPDSLHRSALIDRLMVRSALRSSGVTRLGIGTMALGARVFPRLAVRLGEPQLTPRERAALGTLRDQPAREELAGFLESVEQGSRGPAFDYRVTALPWGFLPEEVSVPVTWWHGVDDDVVPLHQAQDVVARLPDVRFRMVPDASHLAIRVEAAAILESATGV
jgi:pimeloyl-ACP methyl ester carboxylesterase